MVEYDYCPDIYFYDMDNNPTIGSPNALYEIQFFLTRESLNNPDTYERFISNIVSRFRRSKTYKSYKSYLFDNGMDHCQIHGNISSEMADLEMHHNILTIWDITMVICEWFLNIYGKVCSFDVIMVLKKEHTLNHIPLIMLSETDHEMYHDEPVYWIDPKQCLQGWWAFLTTYNQGITRAIAYKIMNYLNHAKDYDETIIEDIMKVRNNIVNWSDYNDLVYYK